MIYAEILAGGKGTRLGNKDLPKQFLMLGSKPIIIHTIEQFVINSKIDKIVVCTPKESINYTNELINKYLPGVSVDVVAGGKTRDESIMNGCKYIEKTYGISSDDFVITHDAVRPFINQRIINDNNKCVKKGFAVDTAIPATDTVIELKDNDLIKLVPDRKYLYYGQTPQSFNIQELISLYDSLSESEKSILTDACKIYTLKNKDVKVVLGETFNIKITTSFDLEIAEAILKVRKND